MRLRSTLALFVTTLAAGLSPAMAEVSVSGPFSDHMVLQRDASVPVWGTAAPGEQVKVEIGGRSASTTADASGRWRVSLDPLPAGGPLEMTVAGENTITVRDVLVGEVWVCSGQSNMAMQVQNALNAEQEIAAAEHPQIRLLKVARRPADEPSEFAGKQWEICSPQTVPEFSAAGYFFGRDLQKSLNVPVGLIDSAVGGTPAESWTPAPVLEADFKAILEIWQDRIAAARAAEQQPANMPASKPAGSKATTKPAPRVADLLRSSQRPAVLYNGMIHPLVPYAIRGAIWYQGESNAPRAYEYRRLFPAMIGAWRQAWGQGDFPFLFVQIAGFETGRAEPYKSAWAELREAQTMTLSVPNTAMAVITDVSEAKNIHPLNKQEVGRRLALAARAVAYGEKIEYSGPLYKSMSIEGDRIRLRFKHEGGGLEARGSGSLKGFGIAGQDRKFVDADATIDGETVLVHSDKVAQPVAVRFGWADVPDCNLYNKAGLPASPFRTDKWPGLTAETDRATAPPRPQAGLPNVLIIGDSISIGYTPFVQEMLAGKANVVHPKANCGDTKRGLQELGDWLGSTHWDVIHFNWGLHDLCYRDPKAKTQGSRDKVNGVIAVPPDLYEKNLDSLVGRLEKTGAKLIWASTTVVPDGEVGRVVGDDIKYNAIAAKIMARHGIPTDDLYALSKSLPASMSAGPGNVHYTKDGYRRLAEKVTATIGQTLSTGGAKAPGSELHAQAVQESLLPVRPGLPGKRPFWNARARRFMCPPAFDFPAVSGANRYRFTATASQANRDYRFEAPTPYAPLVPIWLDLPVGTIDLKVEGLDAVGKVLGLAGQRHFEKAAVFNGPYASASALAGKPPVAQEPVSYRQSGEMALKGTFSQPHVRVWLETGKPDPNFQHYHYPSKIIGAVISGAARYAALKPAPADAGEVLEIGKRAADYLLARHMPAGTPYEFFPPTYEGDQWVKQADASKIMMIYPAEAGMAYLDLYDVTKTEKYLTAAKQIADTYRKTQNAAGTWPLMVNVKTGAAETENLCVPTAAMLFMSRLKEQYGVSGYEAAIQNAFNYVMSGPMRSFNWQGQFEDANARVKPYENLARQEVCQFADYLLDHSRTVPNSIELAEELLRFAEDQFVVWEVPAESSPATRPAKNRKKTDRDHWITPTVLEQYYYYVPVCRSMGLMLVSFQKAHQVTGKALYLEKAKALATALTIGQKEFMPRLQGQYPTLYTTADVGEYPARWINNVVYPAEYMIAFDAYLARQK